MVDIFLSAKVWDSEVIGKYYKALKRMPDEEKCDCTIFVAQNLHKRGDKDNLSAAQEILKYSIESYADITNETKARMYWALGRILEEAFKDYDSAYEQYEKWEELNSNIKGSYAALIRCLLLKGELEYSELLEQHVIKSSGEGYVGTKEDRLYESIAWYLVYANKNDVKKMSEYRGYAQAILKADENFLIDYVFRPDTEKDKLNIPQKVKIFVKEMA